MKTLLFTYGHLKPMYSPPATMAKYEVDSVHGDLYDHGRDPLIIDLEGPGTARIVGYTIEMDDYEFKELDPIEEKAGYKRVQTTTGNGKKAYIYVWNKKLPKDAKRIKKWPVA